MKFIEGKRSAVVGAFLVVAGLFLTLFSMGVYVKFESIFRWIVGKKVVLSANSQGFPIWRDVSDHLDTRVAWYFFNLTNPKEFIKGEVPILKEVGPFWYKVNLTKRNINFFDNASVYFEEHRRFDFDAVRSAPLTEDTEITMLNVPLMAAAMKYNAAGYIMQLSFSVVSAMDQAQNVTEKYKIRELTYEGQPNSLVILSTLKEGIASALSAMGNPDDKKARFGFGIDKNMTNPGKFNMYTGASGVNDINRIHSMDGEHVLDVWPNNHNNSCNIVDGTFGNLRPPMVESNEQRIYIPDMCRSVMTRYQKDVDFHGIRLRRFTLTGENFEDAKKNPRNSCYNQIYHLPSGVAEVGPCKKGAPILMSMPHFLHADIGYSSHVKGMQPKRSEHEFIMDHEPTTGMTVSVRGRLQVNIRVESSELNSKMQNLKKIVLPLFWQEMYVESGAETIEFLKTVLSYPKIIKKAAIILIFLGLLEALIGVGFLFQNVKRIKQAEASLPEHKVTYNKTKRQAISPRERLKTLQPKYCSFGR